MNRNYNHQFKQTRVRINPIKKWTVAEEKALIEFLSNNSRIEKPDSQAYYRRFCVEYNLNIPWKTVRSKVKNMRNGYFRAKAWESGEEAATLNRDQIENGVLRKCSNYYELEPIFGNKYLDYSMEDKSFVSANSNFLTSISVESDDTSQRSDDKLPSISGTSYPELMEIRPDMFEVKPEQSEQNFSKKCIEMGVKENELSFKDKMNVMELILKEKRLELKQKRIKSKEKIKLCEIKSQEKIKMHELQMQERLEREELILKYNIK